MNPYCVINLKLKNMKIEVILLILFISLFYGCVNDTEETILYLVRHAEKDTTDKTDNPQLTVEGEERALKLAEIMQKEDIKAIYSTKYDRNMKTVQPTATLFDLPIKNYEWYDWEETVDKIRKQKGTFLLCGHGDNLLPIIEFLNGETPFSKIGHNEYHNIFKVMIVADTAYVDMIKF